MIRRYLLVGQRNNYRINCSTTTLKKRNPFFPTISLTFFQKTNFSTKTDNHRLSQPEESEFYDIKSSNHLPILSPQRTSFDHITSDIKKNSKYDGSELDIILDDLKTTSSFTTVHENLVNTILITPFSILEKKKKELLDNNDIIGYDDLILAENEGLHIRQIRMEDEQQAKAVAEYTQTLKDLVSLGKGTSLKYIQRLLLKWYVPFVHEIEAEVGLIENRESGKDRSKYGPCLLLLPPETLAVICLNECVNEVLKCGNNGAVMTSLARKIGDMVEEEVNIRKNKEGKAGLLPWQQKQVILDSLYKIKSTRLKINSLVGDEPWPVEIRAKVGAALVSFLLDTAMTDANEPVFIYSKRMLKKGSPKAVGILKMDEAQYLEIVDKDMKYVAPRLLPMLIKPRKWDLTKRNGCYYRIKAPLLRTNSKMHIDICRKADMQKVTNGLDYLGMYIHIN